MLRRYINHRHWTATVRLLQPSCRCSSDSSDPNEVENASEVEKKGIRKKNEALEEVKAIGWEFLELTRRTISAKARDPLFVPQHLMDESPGQISEALLILEKVTDALDYLVNTKRDPTFTIRGDPIVLVDCKMNSTLREAEIYWCLPLSLQDLPDPLANEVRSRMDDILYRQGKKIQKVIFSRLQYTSPRLKFIASKHDVMEYANRGL